ncbi:replication protein [Acinetobacter schindleri]|uniref:replication protein n=1 Tax=Acinetobacter schindleri TaxID=108981 RepID=UPI003F56BE51
MSSFISNAFMLPNDLIDKGYMAYMKGPALACYIFIVRKTRGWNKADDSISLSQLVGGTGYGRDAVLSGVDKLVEMGVIERKSFANQPAKYVLTDSIFAVGNIDCGKTAGGNIDGGVGNNDGTQSEISTHNNNSKTTITKANIYTFDFKKELMKLSGDEKLVEAWLKVRKDKRASNTEYAFKALISEQQKSGLTLNQVLEHCVVNSWKGFKAEWIKNQNTVHGQQKPKPSRWDEIQQLIAKEEQSNDSYGY